MTISLLLTADTLILDSKLKKKGDLKNGYFEFIRPDHSSGTD